MTSGFIYSKLCINDKSKQTTDLTDKLEQTISTSEESLTTPLTFKEELSTTGLLVSINKQILMTEQPSTIKECSSTDEKLLFTTIEEPAIVRSGSSLKIQSLSQLEQQQKTSATTAPLSITEQVPSTTEEQVSNTNQLTAIYKQLTSTKGLQVLTTLETSSTNIHSLSATRLKNKPSTSKNTHLSTNSPSSSMIKQQDFNTEQYVSTDKLSTSIETDDHEIDKELKDISDRVHCIAQEIGLLFNDVMDNGEGQCDKSEDISSLKQGKSSLISESSTKISPQDSKNETMHKIIKQTDTNQTQTTHKIHGWHKTNRTIHSNETSVKPFHGNDTELLEKLKNKTSRESERKHGIPPTDLDKADVTDKGNLTRNVSAHIDTISSENKTMNNTRSSVPDIETESSIHVTKVTSSIDNREDNTSTRSSRIHHPTLSDIEQPEATSRHEPTINPQRNRTSTQNQIPNRDRTSSKPINKSSKANLTWNNLIPQIRSVIRSTTISTKPSSTKKYHQVTNKANETQKDSTKSNEIQKDATKSSSIQEKTTQSNESVIITDGSDEPSPSDDIPWSEEYSCTGEFLQRQECFVQHCPG